MWAGLVGEERNERIKKQRLACNIRPTKPETTLQRLLDSKFPGDWKYVGDGSFIIAGKNPDFININGKKLIVELFGDYWHQGEDPADRIAVFTPYGFRTLVVWEHELKNLLAVGSKISRFISHK